MKSLLFKELRLAAHPTLFLFVALGVLVLVPNYPYGVVFLFGCFASFFTFQYGRETNDVYFTALLPVTRRDLVRAKLILCVLAECAQLLISLPCAFLRLLYITDGNAAGIEANVAFYGFAFLTFGIYNLVFLSAFYKTAHKSGISFVKAVVPVILIILVMETLVHFPALRWLDGVDGQSLLLQIPVLFVGLVFYIIGNVLALRIAVKRFEVVDI